MLFSLFVNCQLSIELKFVTSFVSHSQFLTTFSTAGSQYAATVSGGHSLQEAVFVTALALRGLKCTFHSF